MNTEDIDIEVTANLRLRPRTPVSISRELEIAQEELRLNYYLSNMAKEIEKRLLSGQKFIMQDFLEGK